MLPEITPGTAIGDRYQIQKVIGQGSFGRTYLASDTQRFGDACVLKEFVPSSKAEYTIQKARQLFEREAKVLYQIDHPQIPKFLAWFAANERLFLVQEYINGKTYSQILSERQQQGQLFSEAEVTQWLKDLLPVLEYLHKLNIIHRDISLENMMLPHNKSQAVLIDFGLVKEAITKIEFGAGNTQQHYSQASIVGKYGYAPPEQIRLGQCYPCSDIYALGVCAVVLLTGKKPELLVDESLEWQWHSYVNISDSLTQILDKMLAEKPKQRYQSAREVLTDIEPLILPRRTNEALSLKKVEININKAQKEREVIEITESEEFKLLEQRANQLRKKRETSESEETKISQVNDAVEVVFEPQTKPKSYEIWQPEFLEHCRQELIRCMGPMASLIIEETLAQSPHLTPVQLVEALIAEIPNPQRAEDFRKRIQISIKPEKVLSSENPVNTRSVLLYPKFLEHCQQEMSLCVGPMGMFVLEEILAQFPYLTPVELVEALAAEIPDARRAEEFRKNIKTHFPA
ncbi:protein kinase domain-containing protein [Floridanema aerugineum]|uniref:non-specific serine/threonine protein kinase n=1 Tax=Floridaenema aerugineum BLCC-F46 TaxID=3153654 RepID=A0ABV4X1K2_9CYAN